MKINGLILTEEKLAEHATDAWVQGVAEVPIDEVATMVAEDPSVVSCLVAAVRAARTALERFPHGYHPGDAAAWQEALAQIAGLRREREALELSVYNLRTALRTACAIAEHNLEIADTELGECDPNEKGQIEVILAQLAEGVL